MLQIYKIDETRISGIKNRAYIRVGKILLISTAIVIIPLSLQHQGAGLMPLMFGFVFGTIVSFGAMAVGVNRMAKSYKTMQIILNDDGVEQKADMMPFKMISWQNLKIEEKRNGTILLQDISVSSFTRKMYGRGMIIIQPETLEKEKLVAELQKHVQYL